MLKNVDSVNWITSGVGSSAIKQKYPIDGQHENLANAATKSKWSEDDVKQKTESKTTLKRINWGLAADDDSKWLMLQFHRFRSVLSQCCCWDASSESTKLETAKGNSKVLLHFFLSIKIYGARNCTISKFADFFCDNKIKRLKKVHQNDKNMLALIAWHDGRRSKSSRCVGERYNGNMNISLIKLIRWSSRKFSFSSLEVVTCSTWSLKWDF